MNPSECNHPEFSAQVHCQRAKDVGSLFVSVNVSCAQCGQRFVADGMPVVRISASAKPVVIEGQTTMFPMVPIESARMCPKCRGEQIVDRGSRVERVCPECGGRGRKCR